MIVCVDVETSKAPYLLPWQEGSYLSLVAIVVLGGESKTWLFHHVQNFDKTWPLVEEIQAYLDKATVIVGHNIKFDLHWLRSIGLKVEITKLADTMVQEYILCGQNSSVSLKLGDCAIRYGAENKLDYVKRLWDVGYNTHQIPLDILTTYCIQDCKTTLQVYEKQLPKIVEQNQIQLVKLHNSFAGMLHEMEYEGFSIDKEFIVEQTEIYQRRSDEISNQIHSLIRFVLPELDACGINVNSGHHVSAILFGGVVSYTTRESYELTLKSGIVKQKERNVTKEVHTQGFGFVPQENTETKIKGVYETNKEALKQLKATTAQQQELLQLIQEQSKVSKILSTYLVGMQEHITPDNKIHCSYNQCLTVTGRLSSAKPNLQNLPRGDTDVVAKRVFISEEVVNQC